MPGASRVNPLLQGLRRLQGWRSPCGSGFTRESRAQPSPRQVSVPLPGHHALAQTCAFVLPVAVSQRKAQ
ncbi:hypothetical protein C6A77_17040 [Pseudomonas sp. AFG_SD02_1510_Pfu_092]|nr:hypothetical protein C6A77_17040 [Pseudomonas sp. AFG_SD02_1510_Pfu_092]